VKYNQNHQSHLYKNGHFVKSFIFWDITPCSPLKVDYVREEHFALLAACFMLVSCLAYSSTLKMEAICSSKMQDEFQRTAQHYIPESRTLRNH
jgi:hypothetical protein